MLILARKAERAAFSRIKGQPGAALAAMQSIRRGWNIEEEPVQIDPRSQKMVFRAAGRSGIAIVAEDSSAVSMKLLEKERRNIRRVLQHDGVDRKSTRLNSSHVAISYAVFCLQKKNKYT